VFYATSIVKEAKERSAQSNPTQETSQIPPNPFSHKLSKAASIRAYLAYRYINAFFHNITGGSHPLGPKSALELIYAINPQPDHTVWEIGCGVPVLAGALSASMNSGRVICTDIDEVFAQLRTVVAASMHNRRVAAIEALTAALKEQEKKEPVDYDKYQAIFPEPFALGNNVLVNIKFGFLELCGKKDPHNNPTDYESRNALALTDASFPIQTVVDNDIEVIHKHKTRRRVITDS